MQGRGWAHGCALGFEGHQWLDKPSVAAVCLVTLGKQRHAWVQLIEGDLILNGKGLSPGDGAALDDENEIRLESSKGAHFLLFDLN